MAPETPAPSTTARTIAKVGLTLFVLLTIWACAHYFVAANPKLVIPADPLEFWTFIAGCGAVLTAVFTFLVAVVAKIGLNALTITKKDILTRAERDSRMCAVKACREFGDEIVPMIFALRETLHAAKAPVFVVKPEEVTFGDTRETARLKEARAWITALAPGPQNECIRLLNRFESWAMYFTKSLADESTAFEACAPLYLEVVISLYGALVALRVQPGSGKYTNVVKLFDAWFGAKAQAAHDDNIERMRRAIAGLQEAQTKGQRAALDPALGTKIFE